MSVTAIIATVISTAPAVPEKSHLLYDLVVMILVLVVALLASLILQRAEWIWMGALDLIDRAMRPKRSQREGRRQCRHQRKDRK